MNVDATTKRDENSVGKAVRSLYVLSITDATHYRSLS